MIEFFKSHLPERQERLAFWNFYRQRDRALAHHSTVIPMIRATDFRLIESTKKLNHHFSKFCSLVDRDSVVPIGHFRGRSIDFIPRAYMIEMVDNWAQWRKMSQLDGHGDLAPTNYFCITKCRVEDGHGRTNPGVSDAPLSPSDRVGY